jgi:hypothetical protein
VLDPSRVEFTGARPRDERVIFGVLYGAYDAGGISLERLLALEKTGLVRRGELRVLMEGEALPEMVLAYDPAAYADDRRSFAKHLPGVLERVPRPLKGELSALGIAALYAPRAKDIELIESLSTMVPAGLATRYGGASSARQHRPRLAGGTD